MFREPPRSSSSPLSLRRSEGRQVSQQIDVVNQVDQHRAATGPVAAPAWIVVAVVLAHRPQAFESEDESVGMALGKDQVDETKTPVRIEVVLPKDFDILRPCASTVNPWVRTVL